MARWRRLLAGGSSWAEHLEGAGIAKGGLGREAVAGREHRLVLGSRGAAVFRKRPVTLRPLKAGRTVEEVMQIEGRAGDGFGLSCEGGGTEGGVESEGGSELLVGAVGRKLELELVVASS